MGCYLIQTERTTQRDDELLTRRGARGYRRAEKETLVLFKTIKYTKNWNKIVKGLLLIDYNMSSCAVVL